MNRGSSICAFLASAVFAVVATANAHATPLDPQRCEWMGAESCAPTHVSVGDALEHPRAHAAAVAARHRARHRQLGQLAHARLHVRRHAPAHSLRNGVSAPLAAAPAAPAQAPAPARPRHASTPASYARHHAGSSKFSPRTGWGGTAARSMFRSSASELPLAALGVRSALAERMLESRGPPRAAPSDDSEDPHPGVAAISGSAPPRAPAPLPALSASRRFPTALDRPASRPRSVAPALRARFDGLAPLARATLARRAARLDFDPSRFHPPLWAAHVRAPDVPGRAFHPGRRRRVPVTRAYEGAARRRGSLVEEILP